MALQVPALQAFRDRIAARMRLAIPAADGGLVVQQIDRTFDEHRPRHAAAGTGHRREDRWRKIGDATDAPAPFDVRCDHRLLFDVLQRAATLQCGRRRTADQQQWRLRQLRVLQRRQRIADAGAGGDHRHPGQPGQTRGGIRGINRARFVAHVDDAHAERTRRHQDRRDMATAQRVDAAHAERVQRAGDIAAAVDGAGISHVRGSDQVGAIVGETRQRDIDRGQQRPEFHVGRVCRAAAHRRFCQPSAKCAGERACGAYSRPTRGRARSARGRTATAPARR